MVERWPGTLALDLVWATLSWAGGPGWYGGAPSVLEAFGPRLEQAVTRKVEEILEL